MDLNAIHTFSNKAVEKILGYKVEEIIGHSVFKLWGNTSSFRSNELTIETLQKGEP